ncbi:MAG: energy-coupling factor transporter transmembrane component T [Actinomycetes bacterium]
MEPRVSTTSSASPPRRAVPAPTSSRGEWHAVAWLGWALAAATVVQLAPSPVYVVLVIGIAALVVETHAEPGPYRRAFPALIALGVAFSLVRVVLAAITTHIGERVLFTLPEFTLPRLLGGFTVGGTIETGVILDALAAGFTIVGIMAVFGALNAVISHAELLQSTPRAFHEIGIAITVALAFVPSTLESIHAVREADRARTGGSVIRRGRTRRLIIPVLERGLERAVHLAESMDSRGFAHGTPARGDRVAGALGLIGIVALGAAFVALIGREASTAAALAIVGGALVVGAVAAASIGSGRIRYRRRRITRADATMVALAWIAPVLLGVLTIAGDRSLTWRAQPLTWPQVGLLPILALLPLLAPMARRPWEDALDAPEPASVRA